MLGLILFFGWLAGVFVGAFLVGAGIIGEDNAMPVAFWPLFILVCVVYLPFSAVHRLGLCFRKRKLPRTRW